MISKHINRPAIKRELQSESSLTEGENRKTQAGRIYYTMKPYKREKHKPKCKTVKHTSKICFRIINTDK